MKKIYSLLMVLALAALPACTAQPVAPTVIPATKTVAQSTSTAVPKPAITPQADLPGGIQLTLWHPWTGEPADWLEKTTEQFNRNNAWGVTVALQTHADDLVLDEDVTAAAQTGSLPDLVIAPGAYLQSWEQSGIQLRDLNTFINSSAVGWTALQQNAFLPIFWKTDMINDVRLGLPALRTGNFLFYNQTWAEALGFKNEPQNSVEFQEQACAAAKANMQDATSQNNGTGGWFYTSQPLPIISWIMAFSGGSVQNGEEVDLQTQGAQNALEFLYGLYNRDCAWSGKQPTPYQYFSGRYTLFYSGDSRDIFVQERANQQVGVKDEWKLLPYPSDMNRPVVFLEGYSYAILSKDNNQALAAWLYLSYLLETQNQADLVEATGALSLSSAVVAALKDFRAAHPAWEEAVQYLAMAQPVPSDPAWPRTEAVVSDMAWQLKFLASKETIPALLSEAQTILQEEN